jgi:epoxyqueuosine reductase
LTVRCKNNRLAVGLYFRDPIDGTGDLMNYAAAIKEKALELGFSKCGIVGVDAVKGYADEVEKRIDSFPDSGLMYTQFYPLANVRRRFPWAASVVVFVYDYGKYKIPDKVRGHIGTAYLFDSRRDKMSEANHIANELARFIEGLGIQVGREEDHGVTALRFAAVKAGLGVVRRNNFFYTEDGSWNMINAFAIDKELELTEEPKLKKCPDDCDKCVAACPTSSLTGPYSMNPLRCVSFLTSIGGGMVDITNTPLKDKFGDWVYGCDECQGACPFNRGRFTERVDFPGLETMADHLTPEGILEMDEDLYLNAVQPKFWYLGPDKMGIWKVNALNAMKNNYKEPYGPLIKKCLDDPDERVRRMAKIVCDSLRI